MAARLAHLARHAAALPGNKVLGVLSGKFVCRYKKIKNQKSKVKKNPEPGLTFPSPDIPVLVSRSEQQRGSGHSAIAGTKGFVYQFKIQKIKPHRSDVSV